MRNERFIIFLELKEAEETWWTCFKRNIGTINNQSVITIWDKYS